MINKCEERKESIYQVLSYCKIQEKYIKEVKNIALFVREAKVSTKENTKATQSWSKV